MARWAWLGVALAALAGACEGNTEVTGRVRAPGRTVPPTMHVLLNGGEYAGVTRVDGSFSIPDVPPGSYSLEVASVHVLFPHYSLTVTESGGVRTSFHTAEGTRRELGHPLRLEPYGAPVYFEPRKQMNVLSMFANPMGLMMGFMLLMVVVMPKMMENLDPEEMKKLQENQAEQPDPSKILSGFLGGGAAGGNDSDSD